MNDMIKARRVNSSPAAVAGAHYTLTKVENDKDNNRVFAFAISDDGKEEIYVPSAIVIKEDMSEADIGAGFTCLVRPRVVDDPSRHPQATLPFKWDSADDQPHGPATLGVAPDADYAQLQDELERLIAASDSVTALLPQMEEIAARIGADYEVMTEMVKLLRVTLSVLDDVSVEVN